MSENIQSSDSLQPSWAAHELFALGLTLVLAVWIVSKYGKEAQPQSLTTERDQARAEKRAELKKADEEALGGYVADLHRCLPAPTSTIAHKRYDLNSR